MGRIRLGQGKSFNRMDRIRADGQDKAWTGQELSQERQGGRAVEGGGSRVERQSIQL
jgi:hypothetical protein